MQIREKGIVIRIESAIEYDKLKLNLSAITTVVISTFAITALEKHWNREIYF